MQVCAAVTFPVNTGQHLILHCYFFLRRTLRTTTHRYYLNLQLEFRLIPFSLLLV